METLECHVRIFSTGPKNVTLNFNEVSWELDATFPNNLPAHYPPSRCDPPTLLLIVSRSFRSNCSPPKTFQLNGCQDYSQTHFRARKPSLAFKLFEPNQFIVRKTFPGWHVRRGTNLQQADTSTQLGSSDNKLFSQHSWNRKRLCEQALIILL